MGLFDSKDAPKEVKEKFIKVKAPLPGYTVLGHDGRKWTADAKGIIKCPESLLEILSSEFVEVTK